MCRVQARVRVVQPSPALLDVCHVWAETVAHHLANRSGLCFQHRNSTLLGDRGILRVSSFVEERI
jgi:hypothetical protein